MQTVTIDKDGWIKEAIGIYYPDKSFGPFTQKPKGIVLHGTAGFNTPQDCATYFQQAGVEASVHIIIGKDGSFVQGLSLLSTCWGQGGLTNTATVKHNPYLPEGVNPNNYLLAIEHIKNQKNAQGEYDNSDQLTDAQKATSFAVVKAMCEAYGIPKGHYGPNGGILYHAEVDPVNRAHCPGPYPWDEMIAFLNGGSTMGVPPGWHDDGKTLTAPNGVPVVLGFREYVLNHNWNPNNIPLEAEQAVDPIEEGFTQNPSGGSRQAFLYEELGYTTARGVYRIGIGNELLAVRADRDKARAQIADLQKFLSASNLQEISLLASQIAKLSQVQ